jgi:hypothetical protein
MDKQAKDDQKEIEEGKEDEAFWKPGKDRKGPKN